MTEVNVVIIEGYHCYQLHTKCFHILASRLTPRVQEIIGEHQCGFRRNGSTAGMIFCIRQTLDKMWEYVQEQYISYS